jgi:hypothetical protein
MDTFGSSLPPTPSGGYPDDTIIGLYDAAGVLLATDDDSCDGFTSQLSFGAGTRPGRGDGLPFDGRDGPLAAGVHYLAVAAFPATFGTLRWQVLPAAPQSGTVNLAIRTNLCYANCDGSTTLPVLTVADFGCFLNRFAAGDPYANCDGSTTPPILTVADFGCFLNAFAAGCS